MRTGFQLDLRQAWQHAQRLTERAERTHRRALLKIGAFIRRRARSSIRRSKKSAAPGKPPRAHSSYASLRNIRFALGPAGQSVLIGPIKLRTGANAALRTTIPALMESGGRIPMRETRSGKYWRAVGRRRPGPGRPTRTRIRRYRPHPFMGPALEAETRNDKLPRVWAATYGGS